MSDQPFDMARVRRSFDRAADSYAEAAVLQHEVADRLLQALEVVKLDVSSVLDAGCGTGEALRKLQRRYRKASVVAMDLSENMLLQCRRGAGWFQRPHSVCGDLQSLPFADSSFDLVFSSLALQWVNDLGAVFDEVRRVLRPGGLFVFSSFGPDTLKELRQAWAMIDDDVHVNRFMDMHDVGDRLLGSAFAEPVMHAEQLVVQYRDLDLLLQDLRDIGANVTERGHRRGLMTAAVLQRLRDHYEAHREQGLLPATYEVVYGHAWKPSIENDRRRDEISVPFTR